MTKKDILCLEKIFSAEIYGHLPFQSKSKQYEILEQEGFVEHVEEIRHFRDGLPPMTIEGWVLTELGRMTYCESCKEIDEKEVIT